MTSSFLHADETEQDSPQQSVQLAPYDPQEFDASKFLLDFTQSTISVLDPKNPGDNYTWPTEKSLTGFHIDINPTLVAALNQDDIDRYNTTNDLSGPFDSNQPAALSYSELISWCDAMNAYRREEASKGEEPEFLEYPSPEAYYNIINRFHPGFTTAQYDQKEEEGDDSTTDASDTPYDDPQNPLYELKHGNDLAYTHRQVGEPSHQEIHDSTGWQFGSARKVPNSDNIYEARTYTGWPNHAKAIETAVGITTALAFVAGGGYGWYKCDPDSFNAYVGDPSRYVFESGSTALMNASTCFSNGSETPGLDAETEMTSGLRGSETTALKNTTSTASNGAPAAGPSSQSGPLESSSMLGWVFPSRYQVPSK